MNTDMSKSLPSLNIEYRFLSNTMEYLFLKMPKIIFKVTKKIEIFRRVGITQAISSSLKAQFS